MSETLTSGTTVTVTDMPGAAENQTPETVPGAGNAAPEVQPQEQEQSAGQPQGATEDGGNQSGQRRKWTPIDEIRELRQWRREAKQRELGYQGEIQTIRQQLEELRSMNQPERRGSKANPADFWQDPRGALRSDMEERIGEMEQRLFDRISMSREQEAQQAALRQEQESAVEFIRSQQNYSPEDDEDLIDIIESIPQQTRATLSPRWVAEYAWMKLNQQRGVGDRSVAKARASTVVGQPPGAGLKGKVWSQSEFDAAVNALEKQGKDADQKLLDELYAAAKEGRVK